MAYRCPDCNKFVGVEQADPEISSIDVEYVDDQFEVQATMQLVLNCAECGTELATADVDNSINLDPTTSQATKPNNAQCKHEDLSVEEEGVEAEDRFEGKGRYSKHFYGGRVDFRISCENCNGEWRDSLLLEEQAGNFEKSY